MHRIPKLPGWTFRPCFPLAGMALATLVLSGCTTTQSPPAATVAPKQEPRGVSITPAGFRLPEGTGCSGDVARFRAIMANDMETGHTTKPVFDLIETEMKRADAMCSAGQAGAASAHVRSTKSRFGYP